MLMTLQLGVDVIDKVFYYTMISYQLRLSCFLDLFVVSILMLMTLQLGVDVIDKVFYYTMISYQLLVKSYVHDIPVD
jgi:hypothetical protein